MLLQLRGKKKKAEENVMIKSRFSLNDREAAKQTKNKRFLICR